MKKIILHDIFIGNFPVTQYFGENYNTYKFIKDTYGKPILGHNGVDFGYNTKTPILINPFPLGNNVVVSYIGYDPKGYGNFVRMWDKTQGFVVLCAHCKSVSVSVGTELKFQQLVAIGGTTGWSTGPHLHLAGYYVDKDGNKLNRANGYDGFVNMLDSNTISWDILDPKVAQTVMTDGERVRMIKELVYKDGVSAEDKIVIIKDTLRG